MIKNLKLSVTVVMLFAKDSQKLTKLLRKGFKDQYIEINLKKVKIKTRQTSMDIISNQTL